MKNVLVTGAAGFIGSSLVNRLASDCKQIVGYDNFSTGQRKFIEEISRRSEFRIVEGNLLNVEKLKNAMSGCDFIFHFAANADVRFGLQHPGKDLEQNTQATFNVLEAMRANGISKIAFSCCFCLIILK
jgi:UDP-glucose 4-epimerase